MQREDQTEVLVVGAGPVGLFTALRLAEAGLPPRRFHDLRHGCAALLLASGADLKVVSSILGHSSIRLTADTYAGVVDRLRGDAAEGLERLLNLVEAPTQ